LVSCSANAFNPLCCLATGGRNIIKVTDVQYTWVSVTDLDLAEKFLTDLGLVRLARTVKALYMRSSDADHHCYISELNEQDEPGYTGTALEQLTKKV